jgi:hypothetical protein
VIGGWQIQGTYTYQSGFPVTFTSDAFYLGGKIGLDKDEQSLGRWFNTSAFVSAAGGNPACGGIVGASANCATPVDHLRTLRHSIDLYAKPYEPRFIEVARSTPNQRPCGWQ